MQDVISIPFPYLQHKKGLSDWRVMAKRNHRLVHALLMGPDPPLVFSLKCKCVSNVIYRVPLLSPLVYMLMLLWHDINKILIIWLYVLACTVLLKQVLRFFVGLTFLKVLRTLSVLLFTRGRSCAFSI